MILNPKIGRVLSAVGAALLIVSLFLVWYHVDRDNGVTTTSTGWDTFPRLRIIILVGAILTLVTALVAQVRWVLLARTVLGLVLAALIVRRIIDPPDIADPVSSQFGVFVGLVGALAVALGGLVDTGRTVATEGLSGLGFGPPRPELPPAGAAVHPADVDEETRPSARSACRTRLSAGEARTDHGHHRAGRLVPGRPAAREGLRGARHGPPRLDREVRPHRAHPRPDHAPPGGPARPPLARRRAPRRQAARGLQPRRDVVRGGVVDPADADRRVHRRRRHPHARGAARGLPRGALLPGELERDVRQGARDAADRDDAVLPALAVRRGEGVRPLHHGQLPRVLRPAPRGGDPLQPRVAAPRAGVRHPQDHLARGRDQARERRRSCGSAISTPSATGATRRTTSRRCG